MSRRTMDLIIVSGLSGSGKSVALQSLEDIGYYCVDNLPSVMLPEFERCFLVHAPGDEHGIACAAVSIDSRNHRFLGGLGDTLDRSGLEAGACRILFLDAEEQKLVQRYSETRRKHPLTDDSTPLMEGIQRERVMLRPLQERADKVIDTTDTTPHELRAMVRDFAGGSSAGGAIAPVRVLRLQVRLPQRGGFHLRCPLPSQPPLGGVPAQPDRPGPRCQAVPGEPAHGGGDDGGDLRFPAQVASGLRQREPELHHRGGGLHRRPAPFGVYL